MTIEKITEHKYKHKHYKGYIVVLKPEHHFASKRGYVFEHRLVWEEYYKACLLTWADIHHLNGIKDDNRIENLSCMLHSQHSFLTGSNRINDTTNWFCIICNGKTYPKTKSGRSNWYNHKDGKICKKCYKRINYKKKN